MQKLALRFFAVLIITVAAVGYSAQTPGPGGTYNCWDRCRFGVGCNTSCYIGSTLTQCDCYSSSCGGKGGVVGQGCGDGACWYDAGLGCETPWNCPTDCTTYTAYCDQTNNCALF